MARKQPQKTPDSQVQQIVAQTAAAIAVPPDCLPEVRPGRPRGAKTADRPEAICRPGRCPRCKSSRRRAFRDGPVNEMFVTMQVSGETYNHQLWRNTECLDCGQHYRVIEYRYEPQPQGTAE